MTSNTTAFQVSHMAVCIFAREWLLILLLQNVLDNVTTSTSADILEGGLDAIVQAMVCPEVS